MIKNIHLKITGMHCQSCKSLIEDELRNTRGVASASVDFMKEEGEIEYDENLVNADEIIAVIEKMNYKASVCDAGAVKQADTASADKVSPKNTVLILLGAAVLIAAYSIAVKTGAFKILEKLNQASLSFSLIFLIGLVASLHCIGMCGQLVLAYTVKSAGDDALKLSIKPHVYYNLGRLISYSLIGALLGAIGSFFIISGKFIMAIYVLAGVLMVFMGLSLAFKIRLLEAVRSKTAGLAVFSRLSRRKGMDTPFFIGLLTGFMPCGPLQAVEIFALSTGSALNGFLTMFLYAAGTIPLMLGFGTVLSMLGTGVIRKSLKISGALVIMLGLLTVWRGINGGIYIASGGNASGASAQDQGSRDDAQIVRVDLTYRGYEPKTSYAKVGRPIKFIVNAKEISGCTSEIMIHGYGIEKKLRYGENVFEFTPKAPGTIDYSCGMQMVWGKIIVN